MGLPVTGKQLRRLTGSLRAGTETPDERRMLDAVLLHYTEVLERAHQQVDRLCAGIACAQPAARRVKTLKTCLEKLHREPHLYSLAQVRDLAGMRVVVHGTRADQDEVVRRISALFREPGRRAKRIDRRADPRQGYRAVHLEVHSEGVLIEVQVRTRLQHEWAELFELTADKLGRQLRYPGQGPLPPRVAALVAELREVSDLINRFEELAVQRPPLLASRLANPGALTGKLPELITTYLHAARDKLHAMS
jgi:ppGpp synthetase/RelA/SpoT-type nucleotidyltranferase